MVVRHGGGEGHRLCRGLLRHHLGAQPALGGGDGGNGGGDLHALPRRRFLGGRADRPPSPQGRADGGGGPPWPSLRRPDPAGLRDPASRADRGRG